MNPRTRDQLLEINRRFYEAHAAAFDRSRGARAWPGWSRILPFPALGSVLDIGCGNGRFAGFLHDAGLRFAYTGVDANAALLEAARLRLPPLLDPAVDPRTRLLPIDFLIGAHPGRNLPEGPFDLVVLMGILHHVPGADGRLALLREAARRLAPGGRLALAAWQFEHDPREQRKRVAFESLPRVLGEILDPGSLEAGDFLLRFGDDPDAPPRYCHQVADAEFEGWPEALGLRCLADYRADGARGDANRYAILCPP